MTVVAMDVSAEPAQRRVSRVFHSSPLYHVCGGIGFTQLSFGGG